MAPFYEWGSTVSRLQPLRGGSLLFTIQLLNWQYTKNQLSQSTIKKISKSVIINIYFESWNCNCTPHRHRLLSQNTKQSLSNIKPQTFENISTFEAWDQTLVYYKKVQYNKTKNYVNGHILRTIYFTKFDTNINYTNLKWGQNLKLDFHPPKNVSMEAN